MSAKGNEDTSGTTEAVQRMVTYILAENTDFVHFPEKIITILWLLLIQYAFCCDMQISNFKLCNNISI